MYVGMHVEKCQSYAHLGEGGGQICVCFEGGRGVPRFVRVIFKNCPPSPRDQIMKYIIRWYPMNQIADPVSSNS